MFAINARTRCTEIDAEALQNLRRFFGILAEWDEADRSDTGTGETTNPGASKEDVGDSTPDGLEYQQGASCGSS